METSASNVITPKPPIWMAAISTTCPKSDQCVPVSTSTCPVTQTALVAVNKPLPNPMLRPFCAAHGSDSSTPPSTISARNPSAITRSGRIQRFFFHIRIILSGSIILI